MSTKGIEVEELDVEHIELTPLADDLARITQRLEANAQRLAQFTQLLRR